MLEVLLVEDNEADIDLVKTGLEEAGSSIKLHVKSDGREALRFLDAQKPRPDLVILDLNLPGANGFDILESMKSNPDLREIPVVVFSTSTASRDIRKAYGLSANSYVKKPSDLDEYDRAVGAIRQFWMETAALPSKA